MITIVLAEDHAVVRQGLRSILEEEIDLTVVAETGDGMKAIALVDELHPQILVVDVTMPGLNGLEVTRQVRQQHPETRVVVLSMHANEQFIVEALRHGASAYVLKESSSDDLVQAVHDAIHGKTYLSPSLSREVIDAYKQGDPNMIRDRYELLTSREREILQLLGEGYSGPDIADQLFISPRTVDSHRGNLMAKLGLNSQTELVHYALERGLVPFRSSRRGDECPDSPPS